MDDASPASRTTTEIVGPPRESFVSGDWYQQDIDRIFRRGWMMAAHSSELAEPGSFVTFALDKDELLIVRDKSGSLNAFYNFCRHRGHRLCTTERGRLTGNIFCQYHAWSYSTRDGSCARAIRMHEGFDKSQWGLLPAWCEELDGLVFVSFSREKPGSLAESLKEVGFGGYDLKRMKLIGRDTYVVDANWKVVVENNSECYHCTLNHPELITDWDPWRDRSNDPYHVSTDGNVTYLDLGPVTNTMNSEVVCRIPAPRLDDSPPNACMVAWRPGHEIHFARDYAWIFTFRPDGAGRTIKTDFYFVHEDAQEGVDYSVEEVMKCIHLTMSQDTKICEEVQRGYEMSRYTPGPLNRNHQRGQIGFYEWYRSQLEGVPAA